MLDAGPIPRVRTWGVGAREACWSGRPPLRERRRTWLGGRARRLSFGTRVAHSPRAVM
jgi:hypothetical protein